MTGTSAVKKSASQLIDRFSSTRLTVEVWQADDGVERRYRFAGDEQQQESLPRARLVAAARSRHGAQGVLRFGEWNAGEWTFSLSTSTSIADLLEAEPLSADWSEFLSNVGEALRFLHATPLPDLAGVALGSASYRRLGLWMRGLSDQFAAAHLLPVMRDALGLENFELLRRWCDQLLAADTHLCHGLFGTGSFIASGPRSAAVVIAGPGVCCGSPSGDIGYLLGELLEMNSVGTISASALPVLVTAFEDGYGRSLIDEDYRAALLRVVMHQIELVSFSRHPPVIEAITERLRLVRYLMDSGTGSGEPGDSRAEDAVAG